MEKEIVSGVWVRHKQLGSVHKVKTINTGEFDNKISVTNSPSFDGEYMNDYILWLPKEDEYIWDSLYRLLGKVTYSDGITVSYIDVLDDYQTDFFTTTPAKCEPFFGPLPSFVQK